MVIKKKAVTGFFLFLILMWLCTLISKSVYATKLPMVETILPEERYISHEVEAEGIVVEGGRLAFSTLPGLRVEALSVQPGDRVEEGTVLFQADLADLKEIIDEKQQAVEKLQTQIDVILQNKELAQQKKTLSEERARADFDTTSRLEDTDVGRAKEQYVRAEQALTDFLNDPDIWQMDEETRLQQEQALRDELQAAAYAEADAKRARDEAVKNAGRTVEDVVFPEDMDASLSLYQEELSAAEEELAPYQALLKEQGQIKSDRSGSVTALLVEAGGRTPDTASVLLSDDALPCRFKAVLDQEQKRYVGLGDFVTVQLDGSRQLEAQIDYLSESNTLPGSFEALVMLPENIGVPGASGKLLCSDQGEKYRYCIPSAALYKEESKSYVYVLKEREGILGAEYYAEQAIVKVLDENESYVAVESAQIDGESKIITFADKEIHKGDTVRWSKE